MRLLRIAATALAGFALFAVSGATALLLVSPWYLLAVVPVYVAVRGGVRALERRSRTVDSDYGSDYAPRVTAWLASAGYGLLYISIAIYDWNVSLGTAEALNAALGFTGGSSIAAAILMATLPQLLEPK